MYSVKNTQKRRLFSYSTLFRLSDSLLLKYKNESDLDKAETYRLAFNRVQDYIIGHTLNDPKSYFHKQLTININDKTPYPLVGCRNWYDWKL